MINYSDEEYIRDRKKLEVCLDVFIAENANLPESKFIDAVLNTNFRNYLTISGSTIPHLFHGERGNDVDFYSQKEISKLDALKIFRLVNMTKTYKGEDSDEDLEVYSVNFIENKKTFAYNIMEIKNDARFYQPFTEYTKNKFDFMHLCSGYVLNANKLETSKAIMYCIKNKVLAFTPAVQQRKRSKVVKRVQKYLDRGYVMTEDVAKWYDANKEYGVINV